MSVTLDAIKDLKDVFLKYHNKHISGEDNTSDITKVIIKSLEDLISIREKENAKKGEIPEDIKLPDYITPLMTKWIIQYQSDLIYDITSLGLFELESNDKRINVLTKEVLKESSFKRDIAFNQTDSNTLLVYESSGMSLAGLRTVYEYELKKDYFFIKKDKPILKMIS